MQNSQNEAVIETTTTKNPGLIHPRSIAPGFRNFREVGRRRFGATRRTEVASWRETEKAKREYGRKRRKWKRKREIKKKERKLAPKQRGEEV